MKSEKHAEELTHRIVTEFRALWAEEEDGISNKIAQASNEAGIKGFSASTPLLRAYSNVYKDALRQSQDLFLATAKRVLDVESTKLDERTGEVIESSYRELINDLGSGFNADIKKRAALEGFGNLGDNTPNIDKTRSALLSTATTDIASLVAECTQSDSSDLPPWYERPVGRIVIGAITAVVSGILLYWLL